jgi:hypothetical protein
MESTCLVESTALHDGTGLESMKEKKVARTPTSTTARFWAVVDQASPPPGGEGFSRASDLQLLFCPSGVDTESRTRGARPTLLVGRTCYLPSMLNA